MRRALAAAVLLVCAGEAAAQYPSCPRPKAKCPAGPRDPSTGCCIIKKPPPPPQLKPILRVTIESTPPGAHVILLAQDVGVTPWTGDASRGTQQVALTLTGYQTKLFAIDVQNDGQSFTQTLDPIPVQTPPPPSSGTLHVDSNVPGAQIELDGTLRSETTPADLSLLPGHYQITVKAQWYKPWSGAADVSAGGTASVTGALVGFGGLRVTAHAGGQEVTAAPVKVDGVLVGETPYFDDDIAPGSYKVTVASVYHYDQDDTVTVDVGRISEVDLTLSLVAASTDTDSYDTITSSYTPKWQDNLDEKWPESWENLSQFRRAYDQFTRGMSTWGAKAMRRRAYAADASVGYPRWLELRVTIGRASKPTSGWDYAMLARSDGLFHELGLQTRIHFLQRGRLALGAFVSGSGGVGFRHGQNGAEGQGGLALSYRWKGGTVATLRGLVSVWSDRLCDLPASGLATSGPGGCKQDSARNRAVLDLGPAENYEARLRARDFGVRPQASLAFELPMGRSTNLFLVVDGAPWSPERPRFAEEFNPAQYTEDFRFAVRLGLTARIRTFGNY